MDLRDVFEAFYSDFNSTRKPNLSIIETAAMEYFDRHKNDLDPGIAHNEFFGSFGSAWMDFHNRGQYEDVDKLWADIIEIAKHWENANPGYAIHKGTPYAFWGVNSIKQGNYKKGLMLFHAALDEDKRKHGKQDEDPKSPAYDYVTMQTHFYFSVCNPNTGEPIIQYAFENPAAIEMENELKSYRSINKPPLDYDGFRSRFACNFEVRELVFLLTNALFEMANLRRTFVILKAALSFAAQLYANCLFDLCQVVEESIRAKSPKVGEFKAQAEFLTCKLNWSKSNDPLGDLNGQGRDDFDNCIKNLLGGKIIAGGREPISIAERNLWITYVLRNPLAHSLSSRSIILSHFDELYSSVLKTLFLVVDALY